jgi:hypothetical protein
MQKISDDLTKMKRSFFVTSRLKEAETKLPQVINCGKRFRSGFPLQIHQLTTTFIVKPITMVPPRGSLMGLSTMNGRRRALSYGPTGIVRVFCSFSTPVTDGRWFRSGIWQECSLVGDTSDDLC